MDSLDSYGDLIAAGANYAPKGVRLDSERLTRPAKYRWLLHAEIAAVMQLRRLERSGLGSTAYVTHPPCSTCAQVLIQAGTTRLVSPRPYAADSKGWRVETAQAQAMLREAGVTVDNFGP